MATISGFTSMFSFCRFTSYNSTSPSPSSSIVAVRFAPIQSYGAIAKGKPCVSVSKKFRRAREIFLRSVSEETLIPEETENSGDATTEQAHEAAAPVSDQPVAVAVAVSPSDMLTMFFQAEGTMNEAAISGVSEALQEAEGISNLKVQVVEGIASVELTKQTTVQATGVASNLVEIIQGKGFKLQTLNLSFEDEEDIIN